MKHKRVYAGTTEGLHRQVWALSCYHSQATYRTTYFARAAGNETSGRLAPKCWFATGVYERTIRPILRSAWWRLPMRQVERGPDFRRAYMSPAEWKDSPLEVSGYAS